MPRKRVLSSSLDLAHVDELFGARWKFSAVVGKQEFLIAGVPEAHELAVQQDGGENRHRVVITSESAAEFGARYRIFRRASAPAGAAYGGNPLADIAYPSIWPGSDRFTFHIEFKNTGAVMGCKGKSRFGRPGFWAGTCSIHAETSKSNRGAALAALIWHSMSAVNLPPHSPNNEVPAAPRRIIKGLC